MLEYMNKLHESKLTIIPHEPSASLSQYIDSITYCRGHNLDYPFEKIIPDGTVQLLIHLDGEERTIISDAATRRTKKAWVSGIQRRQHIYRLRGNETIVYIRFRPGGFHALTQIPQWELEDEIIDAELLLGNSISRLWEELHDCSAIPDIFMKIEQFFLNRINGQLNLAAQVVGYVTNYIDHPLPVLIKKTGYSQKHLIQLFKKHIGVTPKYFQRIKRFNQVLNDLQTTASDSIDWSGIVYKNGFYDQSHLIKEFKHFANIQPQAFIDSAPTCTTFLHSKVLY
ncbi:AraC family transcriptional regulator [Prolixibacter sp. NT017]|uniref:helix-turn-helix domain-containing protein n=1 Tax=Prolixibacter sp. NT017 TaxID=2652390 RepID=UPI00188E4541|nr:AraC family transcriptional regulator [Prolixibacter sp. NT017]